MGLIRLCRLQWDRALGLSLVVAGFACIVVATLRARGTVLAFEQIPLLISGGIGGLALLAVGLASWLSADLRDQWRKIDDLTEALRHAERLPTPDVEALSSIPPLVLTDGSPAAQRSH